MSKVFYDHLIVMEEVEEVVKKSTETSEERQELWRVVDEVIHMRIMIGILDILPRDHHETFLQKFHEKPHDEEILKFLEEKADDDVEKAIKREIEKLKEEIMRDVEK